MSDAISEGFQGSNKLFKVTTLIIAAQETSEKRKLWRITLKNSALFIFDMQEKFRLLTLWSTKLSRSPQVFKTCLLSSVRHKTTLQIYVISISVIFILLFFDSTSSFFTSLFVVDLWLELCSDPPNCLLTMYFTWWANNTWRTDLQKTMRLTWNFEGNRKQTYFSEKYF